MQWRRGGGDGGWGNVTISVLIWCQACNTFVCKEWSSRNGCCPLPLLAYCTHVPATRLMYGLVSFLLSHSTATFSDRYQAVAGC